MTAPPRIQKSAYRREGRQTALHEILMRRHPAKDSVLVWQLHPAVRQLLAVENAQRLEDADEIGDPEKLVLVECTGAPFFRA